MYLNHREFSFLMQQIVRTMGMDPFSEVDGGTNLIMDVGWNIYWTDDDESCVNISFDHEIDPHVAAEIAMRFCRILDLMDIEVIVDDDSDDCDTISDSTGLVLIK